MRKNSARSGFTLVEVLIGVVMMSIVIGGIAFTVSSGFDLYTKADSNAVVITGVRFTADSFNRSVAPMLSSTNEIEILSEDSSITASRTVSDDIHYIYLSTEGSVVHRHKLNGNTVNDVLEGSEHIDKIEFSIPVSSDNEVENYILSIDIHGVNSNDIKAKLDLNIGKALYSKPNKDSPLPSVGGNYIGNALRIKAGFYLEALNLYNYDSNENINEKTKQKGIKIEAAYDLINQTITLEPMLDTSTIEWFISENVSGDYSQLYSRGNPLKGVSIDTTGTFYDQNGSSFNIGVIKCKVTPSIKSQSGRLTVTGSPVWSKYVIITSETPPSNMIPGTNIGGGPGIFATDDWDETYLTIDSLGFKKGQKFLYEDKYYVAIETIPYIWVNNHNPDQNIWWTAKSGGGLVEVKGTARSWVDINEGTIIKRGEIVYYDNKYYICNLNAGDSWYQINKSKPPTHNDVKSRWTLLE